jgi:hypothetical protein
MLFELIIKFDILCLVKKLWKFKNFLKRKIVEIIILFLNFFYKRSNNISDRGAVALGLSIKNMMNLKSLTFSLR